jgi:zinc protease
LPAQAAVELRNAERYQLDNGLTVILLEDRNFPVVSVQMLYKAGARNEVTGKTGLAHFLEHMAFRATKKFPDTGVVSRIYAAGGEWHGYTWTDQTTYYATVPEEHLDLLLEIEAERMRHLEIDPAFIEAERGAVLTEMHMYETEPSSLLLDALLATSFLAHPYRNNTIGWESDIDSVTRADLVAFYETHYHPANAVLAVVGDFDAARARERIAALFGGYERRPATPLPHTIEPLQQGERRVGVRAAVAERRFMIGYRAPAATHPDYAAFLVLQDLLAGGSGVNFLQNDWGTPARESRLLDGAADSVTSWFPPSAQDYVFVIGARPGDRQSGQDAEQAIEARIAALRDGPPQDGLVEDAIEAVLDELVYDLQTTEDAAHQLAFFAGLDALDVLLTLPERVRRVTPADVTRLARDYLRPERRTIAWYRPGAVAAPVAAPALPPPGPPPAGAVDETPVAAPLARTLASGLPAIVVASDLSPSVSLKLVVPGTGLSQDAFVAGDPEPGVLAWNGRTRPGRFAALVADAAAALGAARHADPAREPGATDPEARLHEEFLAVMPLPAKALNRPARPAVVVVAGDVDAAAAFATLEEHFGAVAAAAPRDPGLRTPPTGRKHVRLGVPVAQAQLGYLVAAPAPTDPDYGAWRILQYIVAHDYEGRLGKAAISDRGLAYYIDARYTSAGGPGWTSFAIGVDTHKVEALEALLAAELARLAGEPPTAAEVEEARQHLLGREVSAAQSNGELADRLARHWLRYGTTPSVRDLRERLAPVKRDDVVAIVPRFTGGLTIAVTP